MCHDLINVNSLLSSPRRKLDIACVRRCGPLQDLRTISTLREEGQGDGWRHSMRGERPRCQERQVHVEKVEQWANTYGLAILQEPSEVRQVRLLVLRWEITWALELRRQKPCTEGVVWAGEQYRERRDWGKRAGKRPASVLTMEDTGGEASRNSSCIGTRWVVFVGKKRAWRRDAHTVSRPQNVTGVYLFGSLCRTFLKVCFSVAVVPGNS